MATLAEMLRQGADRLVNLPSEAQRFVTNPQAFTQLLTGKNLLPRETGFAAGATGLPAQEMSVLDPNQAPYMQGYTQGEPVGYAGMAAPFAAPAAVATTKALAPKLGQMTENYMVRQGMIQPLTAYHGTPHTIQGQFDINKVGTGEGAQAYGYGMYFAQNPAVAKEYQKMLQGPESTAQHYLDLYKTPESAISAIQYEIKPNLTAEAKKHSLDAIEVLKSGKELKGNLYKVDIPDADIPMMLDYDKPLSQQPKAVQKALAKIDPDLYSKKGMDYDPQETGQMIYERLSQMDMNKNGPFTGASKNVSNMLNEYGIKGIRYLDEGSRNTALQPYYQLIRKSDNAVYTQMQDLKKAKKFVKDAKRKGVEFEISEPIDKRTSNFVVFEPSQVKILEKNDKPVSRKELLQEQINKIE
jgi:hypothetical protein